jgi:SAM-dependent methyltransferase
MKPIKTFLRTLHLLEAAFRLRDFLFSLRFIPRNLRYWLTPPPGGLALPPVGLVQQVTGTPDFFWFLSSGERAAESVRTTLERNGLDIGQVGRILDFGCGCGRVTRYWARLGAGRVVGSDLNQRAIDWCSRKLTFARFDTNQLKPPLPYDSDQFDFAYAFSVFTHLPESLQEPWIVELRRVIRPNGHLLISTHGSHYLSDLTPEQRRRFEAGEIVVKNEVEAGSNRCGAYHPLAYVRDKLSHGFALVEFVPEGAAGNPHQDLFLFRKQ